MNGSIGSGWEKRAAERKLDCRCWSGLFVVGEKEPRPARAEPGMLTGAELPSRPEEANPTDIELLTVGEPVSSSRSRDAAILKGSSKCKSSRAFPEIKNSFTYVIISSI